LVLSFDEHWLVLDDSFGHGLMMKIVRVHLGSIGDSIAYVSFGLEVILDLV
jgi:hypothetical protein